MSKTSPKNKERKQKTKDKGQTEYLVTGKEIRKLTEKCMNKLETMLVILDPRGRIIMLNKQGYKILGYKEGELLGKYWFNTCLPEDERTKVEKVFKKILHGKIKQLKHYENLIITKKGNTKQIEWFNSLLKNNKREIVGVLSSGKDISLDKEQIEKERNAELIRNANSIMLRWKKDKKIEFINDFGLKTFGYKESELIGKNVSILVPKTESSGKDLTSLIKGITKYPEKYLTNENENIKKDGSRFWVTWTNRAIKDKNGDLAAIIAIGNDITKLKEAEKRIKSLAFIIENTLEGHALMTLGKTNKLTYVNKAWEKITGYKSNEVVNKKEPLMIEAVRNNPKQKKVLMDAIQSGKTFQDEMQWTTRSGKKILVDLLCMPLKDNNKITYWFNTIRDITSQEKSQEQLKEDEELFKNIFEYSAIGISLVSLSGHWLKVNNALCKITGYSRKELLSSRFTDITHPDDVAISNKTLKKLISGEIGHAKFIKRYINKKNNVIWVSLNISLIKNPTKGSSYLIVHTEDITENIKKENDIQESEYFFKESQKAAFVGSYKTDFVKGSWESSEVLDSIFCINKSFKRTVDNWRLLIHPDDREMMTKYLKEEVIGKQIPFNKEYRIICKAHNKIKWVNGTGEVTFDKKGNILTMIGTIQDITERKRSEDIIKQGEEKYRRLFETSTDSILILETSGKIVDLNPFVQNLYEYPQKELIGEKIFEIRSFKNFIESKEKFTELLEKGYVRYEDIAIQTRSGKTKYVEFIFNTYLVGTKKVIQCNFRDVTEKVTKEKELDQAKNDFMSLTSHQLRTPLSATKWVLEALLDDKNYTPKQQEKLNDLVISNERLINLVNRLLKVTRIESGRIVANKKPTDLKKLTNDLIDEVKTLADQKRKVIRINASQDLRNIPCDPVLIHEALENLLTNAIDYSTEDSRYIDVTITERNKDYLISVHNEGFINLSLRNKINQFDKFTRGEHSSELQPSGSGLGLYIAKKVVETNGGIFWFESDIKSGTTFYFTIGKSIIKKNNINKK